MEVNRMFINIKIQINLNQNQDTTNVVRVLM
jgi:hypothetical protein